jgi:hypothetical protein
MNTLFRSLCLAVCAATMPGMAAAQTPSLRFEQAVYLSCRDAQAMTPENRRAVAVFLAEHAARYRGVRLPEGNQGGHLAMLVRGGCTLSPDAHLFAVIDRAILAERERLPKR